MHEVHVFQGGVEVKHGQGNAQDPPDSRGPREDDAEAGSPPGDYVGVGRARRVSAARMAGGGMAGGGAALTELRRKLAWAVGSTYHIRYAPLSSWPAEYARLAAARLAEIHGSP